MISLFNIMKYFKYLLLDFYQLNSLLKISNILIIIKSTIYQ